MTKERLCNRCNNPVEKSFLEDYDYQCIVCDEDLYKFETHEAKVVTVMSQSKYQKCSKCNGKGFTLEEYIFRISDFGKNQFEHFSEEEVCEKCGGKGKVESNG
jgi:RecJ-like exonuclease